MVVLGGWVVLMSEVPLYLLALMGQRFFLGPIVGQGLGPYGGPGGRGAFS